MKVLIMGWSKIPHSYSVVNAFQMVHLLKNFSDIKLYNAEQPYFRKEWDSKVSRSLYPKEYYTLLDSIETWNGQDIDIIYSITYPYNINSIQIRKPNGQISDPLPKCIYYTAEFGTLDVNYFNLSTSSKFIDDNLISEFLKKNNNIHFVPPSEWSAKGMRKYIDDPSRNTIISHGADTELFRKVNPSIRKKIRDFYKVKDTDVLLCNMGAMTRNKGIIGILLALKSLVIDKKLTHYKLLLKGMGDLYTTKAFLDLYIKEINAPESLYDNIIFIDNTLSFSKMNEFYNSIDLYLSPYTAEGFNLIPLEVITAGTMVILPRGGGTMEYSEALEQFGCIEFVDCVLDSNSGCNVYNTDDIVSAIIRALSRPTFNHQVVHEYIRENISWDVAAKKLYAHFTFLKQKLLF